VHIFADSVLSEVDFGSFVFLGDVAWYRIIAFDGFVRSEPLQSRKSSVAGNNCEFFPSFLTTRDCRRPCAWMEAANSAMPSSEIVRRALPSQAISLLRVCG
jgi:hypothetical protein